MWVCALHRHRGLSVHAAYHGSNNAADVHRGLLGKSGDLTVTPVSGFNLPDSSNYDSDQGYAHFEYGNGDSLLYWYSFHYSATWSVTNNTDTAVTVALSAGASCSADCFTLASHYPPTEPGDLTLDPNETEYVIVNYSTNAPGTGTAYLSAGPSEGSTSMTVHHVTPHPPVF